MLITFLKINLLRILKHAHILWCKITIILDFISNSVSDHGLIMRSSKFAWRFGAGMGGVSRVDFLYDILSLSFPLRKDVFNKSKYLKVFSTTTFDFLDLN